jgi:creatinine amidohydrolase/Fe(II)-dependent formamide hydrolase-like protein
MNRLAAILVFTVVPLAQPIGAQRAPRPGTGGNPQDPNMARPIDALESVWIGDLTWTETRDAIRSGKRTAIIPTGAGSEQNGPFMAGRKHDVIVRATAESIARRLGDALVAPIVSFVPEGDWQVDFGKQKYPGTIGVTDETFKSILRDVATSLRAMGMERIIIIGDSGGNQTPAQQVAAELNAKWTDGRTKVYDIAEYYNWEDRQKWLVERGIKEVIQPIEFHDEYSATAIMYTLDPTTVRIDQRKRKGLWSTNGVDLAPESRLHEMGHGVIEFITDVTVAAINAKTGRQTTSGR